MLSEDLIQGAKGAAAYTGLPERTIFHLTEKCRLPVVRLGRSLFYRKSDLDSVFTAPKPEETDSSPKSAAA